MRIAYAPYRALGKYTCKDRLAELKQAIISKRCGISRTIVSILFAPGHSSGLLIHG